MSTNSNENAGDAVVRSPDYDLTTKIAPFLDIHLVFPMFFFLEESDMYDQNDIAVARLELVKKTNMMDYAIALYKDIHGENTKIPQALEDRRVQVLDEYTRHVEAAMPILRFIDNGDEEPPEEINGEQFNAEYLKAQHGVTDEHIEALYRCAKFKYECGDYDSAASYLFYYRQLVPADSERSLRALWGKFASEILSEHWEEADRDRENLYNAISRLSTDDTTELETGRAKSTHKLMVLQQRSWLLHWSLYIFFNHPKGKDTLVEFFLRHDNRNHLNNLNAIQTNCPWLLRYLAYVIITRQRRKDDIKTLLNVISQEKYTYRDPIIEFVEELLVNFNFEAAQEKLRQCESVIRSDYFLSNFAEEQEVVDTFVENARLFIFETYCRIHQKIDIGMLANKLSMHENDAEKWVVNMIRNAHFDARIDRAARQVIMSVNYPSIYQQVIGKTKDLSIRTRLLADSIETAIHEPLKESKDDNRGQSRGGGRGGRGGGRGGRQGRPQY
eukprot:gb/GECG01013385.1/.p1 GENE.gb/GECG01013385.1/~~gb/GECG01013385.1/.p1  ORF type:complete len:500 (+),score=64.45 gb/GECG01013385.1/:1-1500(+)